MSNNIKLNLLQEKYEHALKISDAEIIEGYQFFDDIAHRAIHAGPEFKILFHQALKISQGLENYGLARKLDLYTNLKKPQFDLENVGLKTLYRRYYDADRITNKEVIVGYNFFNDLANKLTKAGPTYKHFLVEALTLAQRLEDMGQARKLNMVLDVEPSLDTSTPTI